MDEVPAIENIRAAAVAGSFYPADPVELRNQLDALLLAVPSSTKPPKAMIL